ncbi:leucine-rich repeat protein, partial [Klebsiella pneumoniae]|uniref:leucine-rich repeat protein n=1 Tax=Klebsiella pneumoniae TaxID=573 RepID=UPI0025A25967
YDKNGNVFITGGTGDVSCPDNVKNVYIDEGFTTISSGAFVNSSVEEVYLPESLTSIEYQAFLGCKNLRY